MDSRKKRSDPAGPENGAPSIPYRESVKESEERFRSILEDLPALVCRYTPDFVLTYVNGGYARSFGRTSEELVGRSFLELLPERERSRVIELHRSLTPENPVASVAHPVIAAGGEIRWQRWTDRALFEEGRLVEYQSVGEDITDRWLAEERLRLIVDHSPDTMLFQDRDLRYIWVVRPAVGFPEKEIIGRTDREFPGIEDPERLMAIKRKVIETGETARHEQLVRLPEGDRWMSAVYVPRRDASGAVIGLFGYARDITARKRAAGELHRREREFRTLAENSPDIITRFGRDCRHVYANPGVARLAGRTPADCLGEFPEAAGISGDDAAVWKRHLLAVLENGEERAMEFQLPGEDGPRFFHVRMTPEYSPGGDVETVLAITRDITGTRRAEERLRFQARLLESVGQAVAAVDAGGLITYLNPAAERLFGWSTEEILGLPVTEVLVPGEIRAEARRMMKVLSRGEACSGEFPALRRDGSRIPLMVVGSPVPGERGTVAGIIGVCTDLSGLKRADEELRLREQEFLILAENSPDVVIRIDRENRFRYANPAAEHLFGIPRTRLPGLSCVGPEVSPAPAALWESVISNAFQTGREQNAEISVGDGANLRSYHIRVAPETGGNGAVETVLAIAREITDLRRAEESLLEREQEIRFLTDNSPDIIVRFDPDRRLLSVNSAYERVTGIPRDRAIGGNAAGLYPPGEPVAAWDAALRRVFETGREQMMECSFEGPEGIRHYQCRNIPEFDGDGSVRSVLSVGRDISIVKRMEEDLRSSYAEIEAQLRNRTGELEALNRELTRERETLRTIIDHIPVMLSFYDSRENVPFLNHAFERITGWSGVEWKGADVLDLVYPDPEYRREVWEFMQEPRPGWKDITMRTRDGGTIESSWANVALSDGSRVGIGIDITERKRAENAIRKTGKLLEIVLDALPVGVYILDHSGTIIRANPAGERIWGGVRHVGPERYGEYRAWRRSTGQRIGPHEWAAYRALTEGEATLDEELEIEGFDGARKSILSSAIPLRGESGEIVGAIAVNEDITARRQTEDEIARYRGHLEDLVMERTAALEETNQRLEKEIRENVRAGRELRESEERLDAFFTQTPVGMSIFDENLRYVKVNETKAFFIGKPAEDILGKTVGEAAPGVAAQYEPRLRQVMESGKPLLNLEFSTVTPERSKGRMEWVASFFPVTLPGGGRGAGIISRDITGLRTAHRALRRSERRFRELVESAGSVIMQTTPEGILSYINEYGLRFFGYTREEIEGKSVMALIPERDSSGNDQTAMINAILEDPEPYRTNENENVKKNGEIVTMAWTNAPIRDEQGNIVEILSIGNDISDLKRAEDSLRLSEERYRAVSRLVSDLAYAFAVEPGCDPVLEWVSGPFERITGVPEREMSRLEDWKSLVHPEDRARVGDQIRRHIEGLEDSICEYRIVSRDGSIRWLRVYTRSESDHAGRVTRIYGAAQDITERRRLEENVIRLRREQEALMAHEVKNLLIPLHVYAEMLSFSTEGLDEEQRDLLLKIKDSTDRAFDFANAFNRLYDLETGSFTLRRTRHCLAEVVREAVSAMSLTAERHGVAIRLSGDDRRAEMRMDAHLMPGVFFNLILNAVEHIADLRDPAEKIVRVEMDRLGEKTRVRITNRGEPVPPERLATFFDKFNSDERKKHGVGLGTTYAYLVTRAHAGEIGVTSTAAEGTTVTVMFKTK